MTQKQEDVAGPETAQDSLDDLWNEAELLKAAKNPKARKIADPSLRHSLDAAAKKMRELYTLPENWQAGRGIALIDKATQTLVGNFREYVHISLPNTRKLLRIHQPITIDATELVEGYLGEALEQRIRGRSWTEKHEIIADLWMDELMVGCPQVKVSVCLHLGAMVRVDLEVPVQFASAQGNLMMMLPAGTDILAHLSVDSRAGIRRKIVT